MTRLKWVLAGLGVLLAFVAAVVLRDKRLLRMALADQKRAFAEHLRAKSDSARLKEGAARTHAEASAHKKAADNAAARAHLHAKEAQDIAKELSKDMPDTDRARRFNERHGLRTP